MSSRWSPLTKGIVIVGALIATVWVLFRFSSVLPPLIVALILAYILSLPISWIVGRTGWPRTPIVAIVFLLLIFLLVLGSVLIIPELVALVRDLTVNLQGVVSAIRDLSAQPLVLFNIEIPTAEILRRLTDAVAALLSSTASGAISFAFGIATTVGWLLFVLVIAFYLVLDAGKLARYVKERLPPAYEHEFRRLAREIVEIWDGFFRGSLIVGLIDGVLFAILLTAIGMPNALVLALIAGLFALIPSLGPVLAAIPAGLLALFQGSTYLPLSDFWFAILVGAIYLIVFQVDSLYTVPRIVGQRLKLHPALVIIGAVSGAVLGGLLGVLLAAPVIATVRVLAGYSYRKLFDLEPFTIPAQPMGKTQVRETGLIKGRPVEAVLFDLDGTLVETDDALAEQWSRRLDRISLILPRRDSARAARGLVMTLERPVNGLLAVLDRLGLDEETFAIARSIRSWRRHHHDAAPRLVTGAADTLRSLAGHYRLGVVTTRGQGQAEALLGREGLRELFEVVVTRDSSERLKPHPQPVEEAARQLGIDVTRCVMVGDTRVDVRAAKAAGAQAIGVLSGFGNRRDLRQADLLLQDITELLERLVPPEESD